MSDIIKYEGSKSIVIRVDNYLLHLNTLLQKRYAPDLPELIPYRKCNKWGFCNKDMKIIIECEYEEIMPISKNKVHVGKKEKKIVEPSKNEPINWYESKYESASWLLTFKNDKSDFYKLDSNFFPIRVADSHYMFINDLTGDIIEMQSLSSFEEGIAITKAYGKYSFVDENFQEITSIKYDYVSNFKEGLARVCLYNCWGFINRRGENVTGLIYSDIDHLDNYLDGTEDFSEGYALVRKEGKFGYINKYGERCISCNYHWGYSFKDGLALVIQDNKYGFINTEGIEQIPLIYDYAEEFSEGLALVKLNEKKFFIDKQGNTVLSLNKYRFTTSFSEGLSLVGNKEKDGKCGYINKSGEEVISLTYDSSFSYTEDHVFKNGLARVIKSKKQGFINRYGEVVVPIIYEEKRREPKSTLYMGEIDEVISDSESFLKLFLEEREYKFVSDFKDGLALVKVYKRSDNSVMITNSWYIDKLGNEYREL